MFLVNGQAVQFSAALYKVISMNVLDDKRGIETMG